MPRQRTLKPEFFRDKTMARLGPVTALVYEALWCWADDGGVARIEVDLLKGEAFARWHEITPGVLTDCLVSLHGAGRIRPYVVGDELYAEIHTLIEHSPVNHPSRFRYPRDGQEISDLRTILTGQLSLNPPGALREPSFPISISISTQKQQPHQDKSMSSALVIPRQVVQIVPWIDHALENALADIKARAHDRQARQNLHRALAAFVFAYAMTKWNHEGTLFDDKRETRLLARLTENTGNASELLYAADGALKDGWTSGRDEKAPKGGYLRIQTVYRDREQVERLARLGGYVPGKQHPMAAKHGLNGLAP